MCPPALGSAEKAVARPQTPDAVPWERQAGKTLRPCPTEVPDDSLSSLLLLDSTVLALKTTCDAPNDRRNDIQKQGILERSLPETLSKKFLKHGCDNFLGFFVKRKAITPLTETTLKRVVSLRRGTMRPTRTTGLWKEAHTVGTARSESGQTRTQTASPPRPGQGDRQRPTGWRFSANFTLWQL